MQKTTEQPSRYEHLEQMRTRELLQHINEEDRSVPLAVAAAIPQIERLVEAVYERLSKGGRLFYIGSGTSGRLGIVDASECPPTYGVPHGLVIGIISGGDGAIRKAVEFAEDDPERGWFDLQSHGAGPQDIVVGIAASGSTPYVLGAVQHCRTAGISTGCITCNSDSPLAAAVDYPVEVITGPEFVTGSTRMKAGTAQKLVLNMLSTAVMIRLGHVAGNRMVDMQLSNHKLIERGTQMLMEQTDLDAASAERLLLREGSVRKAVEVWRRDGGFILPHSNIEA